MTSANRALRIAQCLSIAIAVATPAVAEMTAVTEDGRQVILNEDFTWRYAASGQAGQFVLDNWNRGACQTKSAATFTLDSRTNVAEVITWIDWRGLSGVQYRLTGAGWTAIDTGTLGKGSCDTFQPNWCEGRLRLYRALDAGTYQLEIDANRICRNGGSNGQGFIRVTRASGVAPPPSTSTGIGGVYRSSEGGTFEFEVVGGRVIGGWSNGSKIVEARLVGNRLSGTYRYRPNTAIATFDFTFTPDGRCYEGPWKDGSVSGIEKACRAD